MFFDTFRIQTIIAQGLADCFGHGDIFFAGIFGRQYADFTFDLIHAFEIRYKKLHHLSAFGRFDVALFDNDHQLAVEICGV